MPYFLRCSKVEMKNRSNFYLTQEDISDDETVELRQRKWPSGDSGLGHSSKFWPIQEWSLFKCEYCIYPRKKSVIYLICNYSPSFFYL